MDSPKKQLPAFSQYLSLAPVLAVLAVSITFSVWAFFNYYFPDLLFHPMP